MNSCKAAYSQLAQIYYNGYGTSVNYPEALYWGVKAIAENDTTAAYTLGRYYYEGKACEKDYAKALSYYKMGAEANRGDCYYGCYLCYTFGPKDICDQKLAFGSLVKAVNQLEKEYTDNRHISSNLPFASYNLGVAYDNGYGTAKNYAKAMNFYMKAANFPVDASSANETKTCVAMAQCAVAQMYHTGHGTTRSEAKAKQWMRKAAANGDADAIEALKNWK